MAAVGDSALQNKMMKATFDSALQFSRSSSLHKTTVLLSLISPVPHFFINRTVISCLVVDTSESGEGNWFLKGKGEEVASCLKGQSIFLVGMMGCGKTTVGEILSHALGYSFVDSDKYVEQNMGGTSVAQIFKDRGEAYFRENESEALHKLSLLHQQVVATGGGAVVRPINWRYMRRGITVFLDVPLDALARRIAAGGTDSRPLLNYESGDTYTKAYMGLLEVSKKRSGLYSNADATVSLLNLAASLGIEDVLDITPAAIAMEVLIQIHKYLTHDNSLSIRMLS